MITRVKELVRSSTRKLGYAVLDLRKDQWTGLLLPGHLSKTLETLNINCVIDVGADKGHYALTLRNAGYTGRIVSIEPLPHVFAELQQRASADTSWLAFNYALGEKDETRDINIFAASDLSSFLSPSGNMASNIADSYITRTESINVRRLDSVFDEFSNGVSEPRVFLKLDTQGYDINVIKGAGDSLRHVHALQSELSVIPLYEGMPDYLEALAFYRRMGFEPTGFYSVIHDRETRHVLELDAVFTRRLPPPASPD